MYAKNITYLTVFVTLQKRNKPLVFVFLQTANSSHVYKLINVYYSILQINILTAFLTKKWPLIYKMEITKDSNV